ELGEIEAIISQYPAVRETVVVVREDSENSQRIVAYVVPQEEQTLTIFQLRSFLESKLPNYMLPATFVILEALPLTPNGKVDRKALPVPEGERPELEQAFIAPQTTIEKQLAAIWTQVLGIEKIGINDNFFELGGDSILSLQIISKANLAGLHLTPKQLFQHQTIAKLAAVAGTTKKIQVQQNLVTGSLELTPIQHWFLEQNQPKPQHWNQAVILQLKQRINPVALDKVVQDLTKHHDALRSRFSKEEFDFGAVIVGLENVAPVTYLDLSALPKNQQLAQIEAMSTQLQASLNLAKGPLFRVAVFDFGANQPSRLLWVIHHLVVDGVSWRILIEDFQTAYEQICQNKALQLPLKTTSFQQWSSYLQEYAQSPELSSQLEYWLAREQQPVEPIPRDFSDGNNLEESACTVAVSLSEQETQVLLQQVPAVYHTQINDVLLTALVQTFTQWTGETSLLIDLEGHGREELFEDVDLSRTVGWFTTIFPVYLSLEDAFDSPGKALKSIKEQLKAIPNRGIGYGLLRYLSADVEIRQRLSRLPKAEVVFNYLGQFDQVLPESSLFGFTSESSGSDHSLRNKRTHLLEVNSSISEGQLQVKWTYSNQLHRQTTVETLAQGFIESLRGLIAHCQSPDVGGFTPSDFAEFKQSQWQQTDLDAITAAIGEKNKNIEDFYPLSPMQQGILYHSLAAPNSSNYFEQFSWTLQGKLNKEAFHRAWQYVAQRHSILRTCFVWQGLKEPVQVVHRQLTLPWQEYNLQHLSSEEQQQNLQAFFESDRSNGFELTQPPLMRLTLVQLSDTSHNFTWSHHHLLLDGWSVATIFKEVLACYKAFNNGEDVHLETIRPYRDYIVWLQQQNLSQAETFWREMLKGFTTPTWLWADPGGGKSLKNDYAEQEIQLSAVTTAALQSLAQQHQLTLNTLVQGAWALLLSCYTGQDDVVFGAVASGRPPTLAQAESMVGLFINTLPVRVQVSPEEFLLPWLQKIQAQLVEARQHEYSPLVKVQGWSEVAKGFALFDNILVFENYHVDASVKQRDVDFEIENYYDFERTNYPVTLTVNLGEELVFKVTYDDSDRFDTVTRMLGHLQTLLEGMVTNPQQRLCELSLLTETERHQLLVEWNNTKVEYPQHQCIHELFEAQVEKTPDAVAVVFEDQQLTYRELNTRANQLAHYLRSAKLSRSDSLGVKSEVLVGICVERSLSMVIGLLAILKAGGAYVPLDPSYPQERLSFILQDTQAPVLLTQASLVETIPQHQAAVVCLDTDWHLLAQQRQENLFSELTTDNLAYTIYTSGSTGKPKGVQIPHIALSNFLHSMKEAPGLNDEDTLLAVTTYSFDIAALELFLPIIVGARLVIASQEIVADGNQLEALLVDSKATVMQATPATWQLLLAPGWGGNRQLKILCGGEALPGKLANQLLELCGCIWNMYGPTETTIWSAASQVETVNHTVPISSPIANTQLYILDQYHQLVPVGVVGELYIGGEGLARGYFHRPDLTAEKFIPNPFSDQPARLYRTGDLARYLANGEIEYIGRIDNQVKLRGFRIELGEIETLISQHPGVQETVVAVYASEVDSQRIVAYIVPQTEQTLTIPELRGFLESKLPSYMVPAAFVTLEALPLTPNGKVDRKALPAPELTQISSSNIVPPSTPIENLLAGIWAEILSIDKVGINSNFFELGGHSLIATRVISQIRQVFQVELPLRYLFEKPTIAGLAKEIEKAIKVDSAFEVTNIEQIERTEELPLSFAQQRLWFLAQLESDSPFYNIPAAVRLQGQLNVKVLEQSFNEIVSRHEALRTNFQTREGQALAIISEEKPITLSIFDISDLEENQQQAEIKQLAAQAAQQPFDISSDHLLRVELLRLGEQEHIVLLTMHHIVSDGWSIGVLVEELATLYQVFCKGQPSPLPTLPIQYVDFAAWQRQWLQGEVLKTQLSYWLKQLEKAPKVLELPTDYPRLAIQTYRGATYSFELPKELSASLNKLSQQQGSTLFMTLLAAFQTLLWRYTGQEDILVGSPIANRNRAEIEGLIGFFVNTLVLRTNLAGNPSFEELLKQVREVALGAYAHQDLPFELLVEQLQVERSLNHTPLFQVMFVLQNAPMSALELPGLTLTPVESDCDTAKFDLTLQMEETESGLVGSLEYNTDLFEKNTIYWMAVHLQTLLEAIVASPQQRLSELSFLTEFERHQLLLKWNDTHVDYPQQQCIHELFEAQVERTPDAVAVVFQDEQLTYRELNTRANQLAHYLRSAKLSRSDSLGVKSEVLVGICVERSLSMVIGLLAILKAGGAYVPLDPSYPQERLSFILQDTQAPVLLTQASLVEAIPQHQAAVICLDTDWHLLAQQRQENLFSELTTDNLAYVIYTSGSTGKPKGVMIKHSSTVAMLDWANKTFTPEARAGVLASTSICFDLSVFEVFVPLCSGGKVILIENALYLATLPAAFGVTLINTVPSVISQLIRNNSIPRTVQTVNIAGEPLQNQLVQQLYQQNNIQQVFNLYGPSEDTTYSTSCWIHPGASNTPPIGRPIHNTQTYLLDQNLQPVPVGVPGMLYMGGVGLARGYFNQAELTADKFIPNPYANQPGERLYKTGDLARYLPNGEIEYIGRIDNQVKIRGFRIELGEIEAIISQYPAVRETVIVVSGESVDSQRIVAYIVPQTEQTLTIPELRGFLESKLPSYMVPAAFVTLEALPLTPNGKIDRKALSVPDKIRPELEVVYQPPQTEIEKTIANIWQEVLSVENVGIYDNFFELGGHSLLLVQVHSKLQKIFQKDLLLVEMFQHPTVSHLARYFSQESTEETYFVSHRSESRKASTQRRKQARKEHRAATMEREVSHQSNEENLEN
ncbi:MAG: amino acid adenylation domain-containing protein, partial [Desmonostoc geniculatum HA4340-LM1]|nr:amino acid adenylation domain-containing protein [Desmonostoc geniculatum HA4340-LM1]